MEVIVKKRSPSFLIIQGILFLSSWCFQGRAMAAACTQTLSPGANVPGAIAAIAGGSTICLNAGNYGSVSLVNIVKTTEVVVQAVSGQTAVIALSINGSSHLKFQNLTITGMNIFNSASKNITVAGSVFTGQFGVDTTNFNNNNILIDGNSFDGINVCDNCAEGRLQISWAGGPGSAPCGVTVTNNHFGKGGTSDGIQVGAYGVVIGPGNVFDGISQSYCDANGGRHCDALQLYGQSHTTITGNYFKNSDTFIMAPDGGNTEIITNNIFVSSGGSSAIQLGSHKDDFIAHNTIIGTSFNIDAKSGQPASTNAVARDNLFINAWFNLNCTGCTITHNQFDKSGSASGTNNIIGIPQFTGGSSPTTWSGFQLLSTSPGYKAGTDGLDMGATYYGAGSLPTTQPLVAPKNLRVVIGN